MNRHTQFIIIDECIVSGTTVGLLLVNKEQSERAEAFSKFMVHDSCLNIPTYLG